MNSSEVELRFKELSENEKIVCTQEEFNEFQNYGYILSLGKSYVSRLGKKLNVEIVKPRTYNMTLNFGSIIDVAVVEAKKNKINRVYCMSAETLEKYKTINRIIEKDGVEYYRYFENELWLVVTI